MVEKKVIKKTENKKLTIPLYSAEGNLIEELEVNTSIFGLTPDRKLLAQYVRVFIANQSVPSAQTKTRGEVRGGGKKPWKQKGTGRARAGTIRAPHWRGGGIVHGPREVEVKLEMPKKMRKLALKFALSDRAQGERVIALEGIEIKEPKTKELNKVLKNLPVEREVMLVLQKLEENMIRAGKNLPYLKIKTVEDLNAHDVLFTKKIVFIKEALKSLEDRLEKND